MTREEIIDGLKFTVEMCLFDPLTGKRYTEASNAMDRTTIDACKGAIELLEQEPSNDMVSRGVFEQVMWERDVAIEQLKDLGYGLGEKPRHCKDCKYFEYDSVARVDGVPLIVAHEICNKWGNGCKSREDGYCFLFEEKESEDKV